MGSLTWCHVAGGAHVYWLARVYVIAVLYIYICRYIYICMKFQSLRDEGEAGRLGLPLVNEVSKVKLIKQKVKTV